MARHFNADDSDHSDSTIACACGRTARYAGRRPKTFTTRLGPLTLQRAYYHCDACRRGSCPRDEALGLQGTSLSPATTRMVGLTAAEVSFAKASEWLTTLAGVDVETRQVERCAEALGRDIADDERCVTEQTAAAPAPTMYLGMDGTGVPVRPAEVEGRRGKQPDGSAKTREVKLATLWTAEGRDKQGRPVRNLGLDDARLPTSRSLCNGEHGWQSRPASRSCRIPGTESCRDMEVPTHGFPTSAQYQSAPHPSTARRALHRGRAAFGAD